MPSDVTKLQSLYAKSAISKAVLEHFAERQNKANETPLDTMAGILERQGIEAARSAVVEVFRDLEAAGAGEFVVGRRGHASRFRWTEDSTSVGKRARASSAGAKVAQTSPLVPTQRPQHPGLAEHSFLLRPGVTVSFLLPPDLSQVEAARLADFIKALPFDR
jgi:hypothetical protein